MSIPDCVPVPEADFTNVYCADVTAQKAMAKFPDQNPHPVLRIDASGVLLYANPAPDAVVGALGVSVGQPLPGDLAARLQAVTVCSTACPSRSPGDCAAERCSVNTASRMESHGLPGRVQVSEVTFERLRDRNRLESRGTVDVRGRGPMPTWFLEERLAPVAAGAG